MTNEHDSEFQIKEVVKMIRLYVGNLPFETTDRELGDLFAPYGCVGDAKVNVDRDTGHSKGFGFVAVADDKADVAIQELHGTDFGGRAIKVAAATPRERPRLLNDITR
jgi:RNA recognition motif-containing protein